MFTIHYFEKNTSLLVQCLERIPEIEESIKIKGRKGKVVEVTQMEENKYHIHVALEKVINKDPLLKNDKKKRR